MHRTHKLISNIIGSFGIKIISLAVNIGLIPKYISYFNDNELLGFWFSLISVLNWILIFDLGVGNGLRNKLVPEIHNKNKGKIDQLITTSFLSTGVISVLLFFISITIISLLDYSSIFNLQKHNYSEYLLKISSIILIFGVCLKFLLQISNAISYALGNTVLPNALHLIYSIIVYIFLSFSETCNSHDQIITLAVIESCAVVVPSFIFTVYILWKIQFNFSLSSNFFTDSKNVFSVGLNFFTIQISLLILNSTNELLIAHFTSPENTVTYQIYNRIFFIFCTAYSVLVQPLWSYFAKAFVEKDFLWIKRIYKNSIIIAISFIITIFAVAYNFNFIIKYWIGNYTTSSINTFIFALYTSLQILVFSSTCLPNAVNKLQWQKTTSLLAAIMKIPLVILMIDILESWNAIILVNCILLLPIVIGQFILNNLFLRKPHRL